MPYLAIAIIGMALIALFVPLTVERVRQRRTRNIRTDTDAMFDLSGWIVGLVLVFAVVLVGVNFIGPIQTAIWGANTSLNASQRSLLGIITTLVAVSIVLAVVMWMAKSAKSSE